MNDLDSSSGDRKVAVFADGTTLINAGLPSAFSMKKDIDAVSDWLAANKLIIIADKCEMMFFGSRNPQPLKMNDTSLKLKRSCKYLGVHLDKWLRFNQQIDYVVKNVTSFVEKYTVTVICIHASICCCSITRSRNR